LALSAVAGLATAPLMAQEPAAQTPVPATAAVAARARGGPRLEPGYQSYQPAVTQKNASPVAAAAADRTVITISTRGLVLLVVLLIILLA
jgi:hypothetical protein